MPIQPKFFKKKKFASQFLSAKFRLKNFFVKGLHNIGKGKFLGFFRKLLASARSLSLWERRLFIFLLVVFSVTTGFYIRERYLAKTNEAADRGGVYLEGFVGSPSQVNPIFASSDVDRSLSRLIFRGLTRVGPNQKIIGDIANFKISSDGLKYTFTIKKDVYWHDGEPVISDDVLYTISLLADPEYVGPYGGIWGDVVLQKIDDRRFTIELSEPYAPFLESTTIGILPAHILGGLTLEDIKNSEFGANPIGCGPYRIQKNLSPKESKLKFLSLELYDKFYEDDIKIQKITFNFYEKNKDLMAAFERGEIMGIPDLTPEKERFLTTYKDLVIHKFKIPQYLALFFNTQRRALKDQNLRQAISGAINKEKILSLYGGPGRIIDSPIVPETLGYERVKTAGFDLSRAQAILKEAGYKKGKDGLLVSGDQVLRLILATDDNPTDKQIAAEVKTQLNKIGIDVKIKSLPIANLQAEYIIPREYDLILIGENLGLDPDPFPFWHSSQAVGEGLNLADFKDSQIDELLSAARSTMNARERGEKYREFVNLLTQKFPAVFLYQPDYIFATNRALRGIKEHWLINDADRFFFIDEWYIKTKRVAK